MKIICITAPKFLNSFIKKISGRGGKKTVEKKLVK